MSDRYSLLILPGDGIGPEVMAEVVKVIDWFKTNRAMPFDIRHGLVGGSSYDAHGTPLTDETMDVAQSVDAVLLGAVGGPKYDDLDFAVKPERGLLRLRKEMDLFTAPARWEGFGLTPLEAMACGVPTVAARVGAYETLIRDGQTGSLIAPGDASALTVALARWLDDDAARAQAGADARAHVTANHAIEGEAQALVDLYRRMLA